MDMITKALELGEIIQNDSAFQRVNDAREKNDQDEVLQKMLREFRLLQVKVSQLSRSEEPDSERLMEMDRELNEAYEKIMGNENMVAYAVAKEELDARVEKINRIIEFSVNGYDPLEALEEQSGCASGGCAGCSGCH